MSRPKRILTNLLVLVLSPVLVLGALELGFRTFAAHKVRTYFEEQAERELGQPVPRKSAGEYRIFILGGSAAYGFPVADRYSIAAWLRKSFSSLLPGKKVEVVNTAWPGKGSHHVLEGTHTVLRYQPDLFILYSGHNEFPVANRLYLDNRLYWLNLRLTFRSAFYRFLSNRLHRLRKHFVYGRSGYAEKHYREEVIANKVYQKTEISEEDYQRILKRYRENMEAVVKLAKRQRVDVLFVNLPSNLRDIPPSFSTHGQNLSADEAFRWKQAFERGKSLEAGGAFEEALAAYREAERIDPTFAELQYRLGVSYEALRFYEPAKKAYTLARDYDAQPWRAKSSLNEILRELCEKEGLLFVDLVSAFERVSPHGIITNDLIYDNVHPSVKGQQLIADEILRVLAQNGLIAPPKAWQWEALEAAREDKESEAWKVEGSINAYRYVLKGLYLWEKGRYEKAISDLEKGLELMPQFTESYAFLGDAYFRLGKADKARQAFQTLVEKDPGLSEILFKRYPEIAQSRANLQSPKVLS